MTFKTTLGAAVIAVGLFAGSPAEAGNGFHSTTSSVDDAGALVVIFDERELGEGGVDYQLNADATANYACINGGKKNPQAANKRAVEDELSTKMSSEPKHGRIQASLTTGPVPPPDDFDCPLGQIEMLVSVAYTNIVLTDTTNNVSVSVAPASRVNFYG
jgi:hypothetical protein